MPGKTSNAEKIVSRVKGLANHLQEGEVPLYVVPAFWDTGPEQSRTACDVILTNQRIFGYYYRQFPREHLFLDALILSNIKTATWREKDFEPVFREIRINDGSRTVYVRAPRQKCEALYKELRQVLSTPLVEPRGGSIEQSTPASSSSDATVTPEAITNSPLIERQQIHREFNTSPLAVWLLFVGGVILEVLGVILWTNTNSIATGLPLFFAGFVAVAIGFFIRRQERSS
jgi:hypothetical protein